MNSIVNILTGLTLVLILLGTTVSISSAEAYRGDHNNSDHYRSSTYTHHSDSGNHH